MNKGMILQGISKDELITGVVKEVTKAINKRPQQEEPETQEFWTITQTVKFLQVSKVTLWQWDKKGLLKPYRIGKKVRYKKDEVIKALKK